MKKILFLLLAIASVITFYAFSPAKKHAKPATSHVWWNFDGNSQLEMQYNQYYSLDDDNFPDCPPNISYIYCEIYAQQDSGSDPEDPKPDLSTITAYRMRP
jgi:hypothetical protein